MDNPGLTIILLIVIVLIASWRSGRLQKLLTVAFG